MSSKLLLVFSLSYSTMCTVCMWLVCMSVDPVVFDVYSIGLCMSLPFCIPLFLLLRWHLEECETAVSAAVSFGIYSLSTNTKTLPHITSHPLFFHNIPTSRYTAPKLRIFGAENLNFEDFKMPLCATTKVFVRAIACVSGSICAFSSWNIYNCIPPFMSVYRYIHVQAHTCGQS